MKAATAELMAAVRALSSLSLEAAGAAARLALPQIGCSNSRRVWQPACASLSSVSSCMRCRV